MKKILLIITFFVLIIIGGFCWFAPTKPPVKDLSIELIQSYRFPLPEKDVRIFWYEHFEDKGQSYLACVYQRGLGQYNRAVAIYNQQTKALVRIVEIPKYIKNHAILAFHCLTLDSVLVQTSYTENKNFFHDSTLLLISPHNVTVFNLDKLPAPTRKNGLSDTDSYFPLFTHPLGIIPYSKGKVYYETRAGVVGLDTSLHLKPQMGEYDLTNGEYRNLSLYHSAQVYNYFWGDQHIDGYPIKGLTGTPIVTFGYSPDILIYQPSNNIFEHHYAPSRFIDSIRPFTKDWDGNVEKAMQYSMSVGNYHALMTDPYRKQYLRYMMLPRNEKANIGEQNQQRWGIMLLDENFRILGESEITNKSLKIIGFCKEGMMGVDPNVLNTDSFVVNIYQLTPKKISKSTPKTQERNTTIKKENFSRYLSENFPNLLKKEKTLVIPIPMGMSCGPCVKDVLGYLKFLNEKKMLQEVRPILVFENAQIATQYVHADTLLQHIPYIEFDKEGKLYQYVLSFWNPRLYEIRKGKIYSQTAVEPDNLPQIQRQIFEFCEGIH